MTESVEKDCTCVCRCVCLALLNVSKHRKHCAKSWPLQSVLLPRFSPMAPMVTQQRQLKAPCSAAVLFCTGEPQAQSPVIGLMICNSTEEASTSVPACFCLYLSLSFSVPLPCCSNILQAGHIQLLSKIDCIY